MKNGVDCLDLETLLCYSNNVSDDKKTPFIIAISSLCYLGYLPVMHYYWRQQSRPWHIVVVDPYFSEKQWPFGGEADGFYDHLRALWPLALPGLHRIDIEPYQFVLNVLFSKHSDAWKQIQSSVHLFLIEDLPRGDLRFLIRLSAASPCVIVAEKYKACVVQQCHQQQIRLTLKKTGHGMVIYEGNSKKPRDEVPSSRGRYIAIVGGGLAGAGIAFAMAQRGWQVDVFDPCFKEGIPHDLYEYTAGAMTPLITVDDSHKARLSRAGVLRAHARWEKKGINRCGTLELTRDKGHAKGILETVAASGFPKEWVRRVGSQEASLLAGVPIDKQGVYFPMAMQIAPFQLVRSLLDHPHIRCVPTTVARLEKKEGQYFLYDGSHRVARTSCVVIATAIDTLDFLRNNNLDSKRLKSGKQISAVPRLHTLHALSGEIMMVPDHLVNGDPRCVIGGQGYYLPSQQGYCVMGSTYLHNNRHPQVSQEGQLAILKKIPLSLSKTLKESVQQGAFKGRADVRAVVQGRLPVIGELEHHRGIWLACAYASHGLTWSSLAGELIGASLEGEPSPLEKDLLRAISPNN